MTHLPQRTGRVLPCRTGVLAVAFAALILIGVVAVSGNDLASAEDGNTWLALGDSYSSGEGIPGTVDVAAAEQYQGQNCQRATGQGTDAKAWAVKAQQELPQFSTVTLVACTGALSTHLASQISEAQARTGQRTWDLVTFSAGGNDIGFADVLTACLDLNSAWGFFDLTPGCDISEADIRARIGSLRVQLDSVYDTVAQSVNPGGDVIVAGYPHLIEEYTRWSDWQGTVGACHGIQSYDVGMLRSATGYLNQQIALAVADADQRHQGDGVRFHFLDISQDPYEWSDDPGSRHGLCSQDPWLNGQTTSVESGDFRILRSFHPTQTGHDNTGRVLAEMIRRDVTFDDAPPPPTVPPPACPPNIGAELPRYVYAAMCIGDWAVVLESGCASGHSNGWIFRADQGNWQQVGSPQAFDGWPAPPGELTAHGVPPEVAAEFASAPDRPSDDGTCPAWVVP
jgi:lysophospholipase L1-like esterase